MIGIMLFFPLSGFLTSDLWKQGVFAFSQDSAMAGPGVFVQFLKVFYNACSQRIEMDVTNQFQEIWIFFAHDGFVAVLK